EYGRAQSSSVSPRGGGYGSSASTPHSSNGGGSYVTGATTGVTMNGSYSTATPGAGAGGGTVTSVAGSQLTNMGVPGSPAATGLFNSSSRVGSLVSSPFATMNPFALPTCNSQTYGTSPLLSSGKTPPSTGAAKTDRVYHTNSLSRKNTVLETTRENINNTTEALRCAICKSEILRDQAVANVFNLDSELRTAVNATDAVTRIVAGIQLGVNQAVEDIEQADSTTLKSVFVNSEYAETIFPNETLAIGEEITQELIVSANELSTTLKKKPPGGVRTSRTPENIVAVRVSIEKVSNIDSE
ncbi:hypothetical protein C0J52_09326, partial [Blattella germanica]